MKNIRNIFRMIKMSEYKQKNMVAHHESGHAVIGYLLNHSILEININYNLKKGIPAYTLKDYGDENPIIDIFVNKRYSLLKEYSERNIKNTAKKYCMALLAGPISETFFKFGTNYSKGIMSQNTPDFNNTISTATFLYPYNINDYIGLCSNQVADILRMVTVWETVKLLAENVMNSKDYRLNKEDIYKLFDIGKLKQLKKEYEINARVNI